MNEDEIYAISEANAQSIFEQLPEDQLEALDDDARQDLLVALQDAITDTLRNAFTATSAT